MTLMTNYQRIPDDVRGLGRQAWVLKDVIPCGEPAARLRET